MGQCIIVESSKSFGIWLRPVVTWPAATYASAECCAALPLLSAVAVRRIAHGLAELSGTPAWPGIWHLAPALPCLLSREWPRLKRAPVGGGGCDRLSDENAEPRSTLHSVPALPVCRRASETRYRHLEDCARIH